MRKYVRSSARGTRAFDNIKLSVATAIDGPRRALAYFRCEPRASPERAMSDERRARARYAKIGDLERVKCLLRRARAYARVCLLASS